MHLVVQLVFSSEVALAARPVPVLTDAWPVGGMLASPSIAFPSWRCSPPSIGSP